MADPKFKNYDEEYLEFKSQAITEFLKETRKEAHMTQEELRREGYRGHY